jgi:hypothetical protein
MKRAILITLAAGWVATSGAIADAQPAQTVRLRRHDRKG